MISYVQEHVVAVASRCGIRSLPDFDFSSDEKNQSHREVKQK
jgi:hypothetical protein